MSKTAILGEVAGVQVPRSPLATPPAELMKLAGYWRDILESRSEGRRLLAEAGVPDGFSFVLKNRNVPNAITAHWHMARGRVASDRAEGAPRNPGLGPVLQGSPGRELRAQHRLLVPLRSRTVPACAAGR